MNIDFINKIAIQCFTGIDNKTTDIVKVCFFIAFFVIICGFCYETYYSHKADLMNLALSISALFSGTGITLFLKKDTEPKA